MPTRGAGSGEVLDVVQILPGARGAEIEVGTPPCGGPGYDDRVSAGLSARRAPDVLGQDLGSLLAGVAQQDGGAGGDPEDEVPAGMLAELQVGDPWQKLIDHHLAARPHLR